MRRTEIEILEDHLDDDPPLTRWDLEPSIDLVRDGLDDDEDDLGFRALYEDPEAALRASRRSIAARPASPW